MSARTGPPTRAEVCAVACAEAWRGDGEILANPIGTIPTIGGRLAKATFEPLLVMTDGEAMLVENIVPVGVDDAPKVVSGWKRRGRAKKRKTPLERRERRRPRCSRRTRTSGSAGRVRRNLPSAWGRPR